MQLWYKPKRGPVRETSELSLVIESPEELQKIIKFFQQAESSLIANGDQFNHSHLILSEWGQGFRSSKTDIIINNFHHRRPEPAAEKAT